MPPGKVCCGTELRDLSLLEVSQFSHTSDLPGPEFSPHQSLSFSFQGPLGLQGPMGVPGVRGFQVGMPTRVI